MNADELDDLAYGIVLDHLTDGPETLSMYGSSLRSFSMYEDETGRELSINVYEKENNEQ